MVMLLNVFDKEVAIGVPEHELEYNSQLANVPKEPPFTVKLTSPVAHKESLETSSETGSFDDVAITISTEMQFELLQLSALT